jgi:hypothetical protein
MGAALALNRRTCGELIVANRVLKAVRKGQLAKHTLDNLLRRIVEGYDAPLTLLETETLRKHICRKRGEHKSSDRRIQGHLTREYVDRAQDLKRQLQDDPIEKAFKRQLRQQGIGNYDINMRTVERLRKQLVKEDPRIKRNELGV